MAEDRFAHSVLSYLDGSISDGEFDELQQVLRRDAARRREYFYLCRHAQECAEVTDRRGLEFARDRVGLPGSSPPVRIALAAVAAAVALLFAVLRPWQQAPPSAPESVARAGAGAAEAGTGSSRLLQLDRREVALAADGMIEPVVWEDELAILPGVPATDPAGAWLDSISLTAFVQNSELDLGEDLRL